VRATLCRASKRSPQIVDTGLITSVLTSSSHIISGQISRKQLEIADSFLLGAYRKVAKVSPMVTSPMTLSDPITS